MFSHVNPLIQYAFTNLYTGATVVQNKRNVKNATPLIVPSQSSDVSRCWMHNFLWALIDFVPALPLSMLCLLTFCLGFPPAPEIRWNPGRIAELIFWWQLSNNGAQELMGKCFFFLSFRLIIQGSCLHGSQELAETGRLRCIQKHTFTLAFSPYLPHSFLFLGITIKVSYLHSQCVSDSALEDSDKAKMRPTTQPLSVLPGP